MQKKKLIDLGVFFLILLTLSVLIYFIIIVRTEGAVCLINPLQFIYANIQDKYKDYDGAYVSCRCDINYYKRGFPVHIVLFPNDELVRLGEGGYYYFISEEEPFTFNSTNNSE